MLIKIRQNRLYSTVQYSTKEKELVEEEGCPEKQRRGEKGEQKEQMEQKEQKIQKGGGSTPSAIQSSPYSSKPEFSPYLQQ